MARSGVDQWFYGWLLLVTVEPTLLPHEYC
jgi:hypothetical protein